MKLNLKLITKNSFKIIWNHPILWLLGFFASIFITNRISLILLSFNKIVNWIKILITLEIFENSFQISDNFLQSLLSLPIKNIIFLLLSLFIFFYISIISQVSIISYFSNDKKNKKIINVIKDNHKKVWKVFSIYILSILIIGLILYIFKLSFKFALPISILFYVNIFIIILFFLGLITRIIIFTTIINNKNIIDSIKNGWSLFWNNIFQIIKTCLYLFLLSLLFGLGLILIAITTAFPFIALIALFMYLKSSTGFQIIIIIWPIIQSLILTILFAIFSAFQYSIWIKVFNKINK